MAPARAKLVQQRQNPLRERYRSVPAEAWIRDGAQTINGCGGDAFHGAVIPDNSGGTPLCFGIHHAIGGDHDFPNPGDLLSSALAACLDSTLRMIAEHLGVRLQSLEVKVQAELDVRGCLMVDRSVPVGFQKMHCSVRLQPEGQVDAKTLQTLLRTAETCCVVLQTLRNGVTVSTQVDPELLGPAGREHVTRAGASAA
ncbi:MAG TPA: OsmC family protein [Casimicrobiaceae bacterium]